MTKVILLLSTLAACSPVFAEDTYLYGEVSQGAAFSSSWTGDYPTSVQAGVHHDITDRFYIRGEVQHISNAFRGCNLEISGDCKWKHDDREETWLNQFSVTIGFRMDLR
jgi:hypothetical protein